MITTKFAKIINGSIVPYIEPNHIIGDYTDDAIMNGFKEIIEDSNQSGSPYEDGDYIIIPSLIPQVTQTLTLNEIREIAYKNELIINWDDKMFSCDEFRIDRLSVYYYSNSERYEDALNVWVEGRRKIQEKYTSN